MILVRFLFNFVLFGVLFFLIAQHFPDFFATLASWVQSIVEILQKLGTELYNKVVQTAHEPKHVEPVKTAVLAYMSRFIA